MVEGLDQTSCDSLFHSEMVYGFTSTYSSQHEKKVGYSESVRRLSECRELRTGHCERGLFVPCGCTWLCAARYSTTVSVVTWILYEKNLLIQKLLAGRDEMLSGGCIDFSLALVCLSVAPQWPVVVAGCHDVVGSAVAIARPSRYRGRPLSAAAVEMLSVQRLNV